MAQPQRDTALLSVGHKCSLTSCHLVDFLPFKCQHCQLLFCAEHFKVDGGHKCDKYDESKFNRVAPPCPLCNEPVAIRPNQDPNIQMEHHISTQCSVMTGKRSKPRSSPTCARTKCGKVLFAPIRCAGCKEEFCPEHRFPADHACPSSSLSNAPPAVTGKVTLDAIKQTLNNAGAMSARAAAAAAAEARAAANKSKFPRSAAASASALKPSSSSNSTRAISSPLSVPNPFNQADRRARAERDSKRKAMLERAKKGLLSEEEKRMLAEETETVGKTEEKKDGECVVM